MKYWPSSLLTLKIGYLIKPIEVNLTYSLHDYLIFYKIDQSKTCFAFKIYWSSTLISYLYPALHILFIRITAIRCVWLIILWIHQKFYNLHFWYSPLCVVGNGSHGWLTSVRFKYKPGYKSYDLLQIQFSHWLKLQHLRWRANLLKDFF